MVSVAGIPVLVMLAASRPSASLPVRVIWDSPAGCSDAESFFASLLSRAERVRRAEAGEDGARLEVKLARLGPRVHGELRLVGDDDKSDLRKVDGATCDEVSEALSLTAALALGFSSLPAGPPPAPAAPSPSSNPSNTGAPGGAVPATRDTGPAVPSSPATSFPAATAAPPPPAPSPPASPAPAPVQPASTAVAAPVEAPVVMSAPGPSSPSRFEVGLGPVLGEVVAPHLGLGGAVFVRFGAPEAEKVEPSVSLGFLYLRNQLLGGSKDAVFRLTAATLTACPGWGWRDVSVAVEVCGLAVGGWLAAWDDGVTVQQSAGRTWWSAGGVLRARAALGRGFSLQLDASVAVPLVQRRFVTTTPDETVGQSPDVAGTLGLFVVRRL